MSIVRTSSSSLAAILQYKPETLFSVPPAILLLAKDPRVAQYDLLSVQRVVSAAASLNKELGKAVEKRFKETFGTDIFGF